MACLPPEAAGATLLELRVGPFWTVVHTTSGCGMSSSMVRDADPHVGPPIRGAGELTRRSPLELLELLRSASPPEAAIGLATLNALLQPPPGLAEGENAETILRERGEGRRVAMIGRFPFVDRLRSCCREVVVFERGGRGRVDDLGESDLDRLLPEADVVAITATTLLNGTLSAVLRATGPDAFKVMLGPSTPLHPVLLEVGFDVLCGSLVLDPTAVLCAASEGAVTRQIPAVRRVSLWRRKASATAVPTS